MGQKQEKVRIRFSIEGSKRGFVLAEILATEKDYVSDLKLVVEVSVISNTLRTLSSMLTHLSSSVVSPSPSKKRHP